MKRTGVFLLLSSALLLAACDTTPVADKTAPSVMLDASPSVTTSGTVALKATASDNVGVVKVSFYRGDTLVSEDITAPYEATDTVPADAIGRLSYRAVAVDAAGNKTEAKAETVVTEVADKTAPSIVLEASPSTLTASGSVKLKATASDNKGVTKVSFYRGDTLLITDQTAPYEATDTVSVQAGGQVSYRAVAEDAAGNKAEAKKDVTLSVAGIGGTVVEGQRQVATDGTPSLTLTAWAGGSGIIALAVSDVQAQQPVHTSTAPLAAAGTFKLDIPEPQDSQIQTLDPSSCGGSMTVSDPQVRGTSASLVVDADKDGSIIPYKLVGFDEFGVKTESGTFIYVDRAVTISGACTWYYLTEKFDNLTLQKGWNKVHIVAQGGANGTLIQTYSNAAFPDNWVYLNDWVYLNGSLGAASVSSQILKRPKSSLFR